MAGKTIRIFLTEGVPTGVLTAEIINWTGKVIVSPRAQLSALAKREEIRRTGVYCLVGPDPSGPHRTCLYVGEGDNVFSRLTAHDKDDSKDFWTRAIVVISKDANLTKSHGRYLESNLITMAHDAKRAVVTNGTAPPLSPLPESDVADMEYFLEQVQLILPVLGFLFLQPSPNIPESSTESTVRFIMRDAGTQAQAIEANGEFIVLKGSTARKTGAKSWQDYPNYRELRDQLIGDGKLVDSNQPDYYAFAENIPFSSPSAAATVVAAANRNGRLAWKLESGQTYGEWHEAKLEEAVSEELPSEK